LRRLLLSELLSLSLRHLLLLLLLELLLLGLSCRHRGEKVKPWSAGKSEPVSQVTYHSTVALQQL